MDELLDAGTTEVLYAIDGLSDESYNEYRRGGTLDQVKANLAKLTEGKRSRGGSKPNVVLQFVVMKHNEHEIDELIKLAHEYGADEVALTPVCINDFFGVEKRRLIDKYMPENPRYQQYKFRNGKIVERKPAICNWVFQSVVLYNGDVSICCFDYDGKHIVGNAFDDGGFLGVWQSERYRKLRKAILERKLKLCNECDLSTVKPLHVSTDGDLLGRRR
jgi:MoaA/NifB/PqqE/SkfB family radical SAM enzyme